MAKKKVKTPKFNVDSKKLVQEYHEADRLLTTRIEDKRFGFDTYDKLYNAYIDPKKWPYDVKLATPRGFTGIYNKSTRMIGGRFTGRVEGVEPGDEAGAKIATEHFKWSVNRFNQHSDRPIEGLLSMYDTNTRLYGGGFMRYLWKTETKSVYNPKTKKKEAKVVYDNWWAEVVNNRDLLLQPGRETIAGSDYVILRRYVSLEQLEKTQEDGAAFDEGALKELKEAKTGHGKDQNYIPIVKTVKGQDWEDERFEVCTTYYKDRWVTWCPKRGTKGNRQALILRSIDNPYRHGEIPIVPLVYIPSQEDIYGMSELQPVSALLKILSALQSQMIELVNQRILYPPTLVSATETRIDTFKYRPRAFWLVNDPSKVQVLDQKGTQSLAAFSEIYKMIVTEYLEAMGETGQGVSNVDLLGGGDKTATEVKDRAFLRNARDNFNKLMLSAALRKGMYLIFEMLRDSRFTEKNTVIKVVGKDALEYFDKQGFSSWGINDAGYQLVYEYANEIMNDPNIGGEMKLGGMDVFQEAYDLLLGAGALDQFAEPLTPVMTAKGLVPKMDESESEGEGYLHVNPDEDYLGQFNFIPDVEALGMPDSASDYQARTAWYEQAKASEQSGALQRDGFQLKHKDILTKLGELSKIKEAEQYFEKVEEQPQIGGVDETVQGGPGAQGVGLGGQGIPQEQVIQGAPVAPNGGAGPVLPPTQ